MNADARMTEQLRKNKRFLELAPYVRAWGRKHRRQDYINHMGSLIPKRDIKVPPAPQNHH